MILLTPGPTQVGEEIRQSMSKPAIHHRTKEFEDIFVVVKQKLHAIMPMDELVFLAGSGTAAMEACVKNICQKKALVIDSGKFGERFSKIVLAHNKDLALIKNEWNTPVSTQEVLDMIRSDGDIDSIFIQVCESSGGLRHNVEEIAQAVKEQAPHVMIVADGITAVGVERLELSHIDALIAGSQKAFGLPPGLAIVGLSHNAIRRIETVENRGFYLDLKKELNAQKNNTTAFTPATTLIIGLDAVCDEIAAFGLEQLYAQTKKRHKAALAAIKAIGLEIFPLNSAPSMMTIFHPRSSEIRKVLKDEFGVNVAGGQDELKTKLIRINNMGFVEPNHMLWALNSLELSLSKLEIRDYDASAARVFSDKFLA